MPCLRSVLTIGGFDGVHLGHAALVRRARGIAEEVGGARVVALCVDPHPATVLRPGSEPERLTGFARRAELLGLAGADEVVRLEPTGEFLAQSPEAFIERVVGELAPVALVEGEDFRFGKGRAGDIGVLARLGASHGFGVEVVAPVEAALSDHTVVRASSTITRWLLSHRRVVDAARVLGREYEVEGEVVRGDQRGRTIGYPTANVRTECMIPGDGVYAGTATILGEYEPGLSYPAAISVGTKPTFGDGERALEAYLLGYPGAGEAGRPTSEYGWRIRVTFGQWLRDQARFGSVEALLSQMELDCARVERGAKGHAGCR